MPNIKTYDQPNLGIQANEVGPDAFAQAGRRIGAAYSDMSEDMRRTGQVAASTIDTAGQAYDEYETHKEISSGAPAFSNALLNMTTQWNSIAKNTDPNNTAVAGKFREDVLEPTLTKLQDSFSTEKGQNWALEQANAIRDHMQHKIIADQSSMASQAVVQNVTETTNTLANNVRQDPSALDASLGIYTHAVGHIVKSSPSITPEAAARVYDAVTEKGLQAITWSAIQGAIEKNPAAGLQMASDPRYAKYINASEADRFAKEVERQNKVDATNARLLQNDQDRRQSEATFDKFNVALHSDNPPTMADIRNIPPKEISAEHREGLFNISEKMSNKEDLKPAAVYAQGLMDTITDIWRPQGDPKKVTTVTELQKRYSEGMYDLKGYNQARKELLDPMDEQGATLQGNRATALKIMAPILNPRDDAGSQHHQGFDRVQGAYVRIRQLEDLSREKTGDPNAVYDPKSPYYYRNDASFQPPSPWLVQQEATANTKAERVPDNQQPVVPPRPKDAPPDSVWNPQYKAYTKSVGGRIKGWQ